MRPMGIQEFEHLAPVNGTTVSGHEQIIQGCTPNKFSIFIQWRGGEEEIQSACSSNKGVGGQYSIVAATWHHHGGLPGWR